MIGSAFFMSARRTLSVMELLSGYQFVSLDQLPLRRAQLLTSARQANLLGTVLIAPEGINLAVTGDAEALDSWLEDLAQRHGIDALITHRQAVDQPPFQRLKVRIKPEIIRFDEQLVPGQQEGATDLDPVAWQQLLQDPALQLVDTRNRPEVRVGRFRDAKDPGIERFTEFAAWCERELDPSRPVAIYCTGGVRCEKAGIHLKQQGFEQVYQLEGGILNYLRDPRVDPDLWQGECFVFDDRISVDHQLQATQQPICELCRCPAAGIDAEGMPPLDAKQQCQLCAEPISDERLSSVRERLKQSALQRARALSEPA